MRPLSLLAGLTLTTLAAACSSLTAPDAVRREQASRSVQQPSVVKTNTTATDSTVAARGGNMMGGNRSVQQPGVAQTNTTATDSTGAARGGNMMGGH